MREDDPKAGPRSVPINATAHAGDEQTTTGYRVRDRRFWNDEADEATEAEERKPTYVQKLERRIEELEAHAAELKRAAHASIDEVERAKERIEREATRNRERQQHDAVAPLLDLVDDLERALEAARSGGDLESLIEGVSLVRKRFLTSLQERGVLRDDPCGQPFDPALHEAVGRVPGTAENAGTIAHVVRAGFRAGDRALRPAQVVVYGSPA